MKIPTRALGYCLIAVAATIGVGLLFDAYFGPGQNAARDKGWLEWAIWIAVIGGALSCRRPEGKKPADAGQSTTGLIAACMIVLAHYFLGSTAAFIVLVISMLVFAVLIARRRSESSGGDFQAPSDPPSSPPGLN